MNTIDQPQRNALYLVAAVCMIFMTMILAVQPLFLRNVLQIPFAQAGMINSNIQVVTEILDLFALGYLGHLSDRVGRVRIITIGFAVAALGAVMAPASLLMGTAAGAALAAYYLARVVTSLGASAVWPQLSALAGDFSDRQSRSQMMTNTVFMMAFGVTLVYAVLMQIPAQAGVIPTMVMTAALALIGVWLSRTLLVDVAPKSTEPSVPWKRIYGMVRQQPRLALAFYSSFFARSDMVFVGLFLMLWFLYFSDLVGVRQENAAARAGLLIGLMGCIVLISIPVWRLVVDHFGRVHALVLGTGLSALGFFILGFVVNPFDWFIIVPIVLLSAGQAGCFVGPQILVVDHTPRDMLGSVMGAFNVVGGIGIIVFVQVGGILFDSLGPPAPFILIGAGNALVTLLGMRLFRSTEGDETNVSAV